MKGFTPGSAGGPDGLKPQHLAAMSAKGIRFGMVEAFAEFSNLVLARGIAEWARAHFFGGTLHTFLRSDGGFRPIVVGLTLRRLMSKLACTKVVQKSKPILAPRHA